MKRLLVTGGSGLVGGSVACLALDRWEVSATYNTNQPSVADIDWHGMDVTRQDSVREVVKSVGPDLIVHAAALADIDACEANPELAWDTNATGTRHIVEAASAAGCRLLHLSTSNVFNGDRGGYLETDPTSAINVYSRTKIASEQAALSREDGLVVRTSLVLGFPKTAGRSFLAKAVDDLRNGHSLRLPENEIRSPIDSRTLSSCILELGSSPHTGIFHIAGTEKLSRYEMGLRIADKLRCDRSLVMPTCTSPPERAPRPRDASLDTSKARKTLGTNLPDCGEAIDRAFKWAGIG